METPLSYHAGLLFVPSCDREVRKHLEEEKLLGDFKDTLLLEFHPLK